MDWLILNSEWVFSGFGVAVAVGVIGWVLPKKTGGGDQNNSTTINISPSSSSPAKEGDMVKKSLDDYKNCTKILFIDDDTRFKVVKILTNSGWVHTKLIKDCESLDQADVVDADILFIDVQGVGVSMGFSDEGLGLALAIKDKYKHKKVVIYSAETEGKRFHEALRKADSFLEKNADPYQFQRLVEEFTVGIDT